MSWARIMVPLAGSGADAPAIAAGALLAEPFGAELAGVFAPVDAADIMPWMGEGYLGGIQASTLESIRAAAAAGEASARSAMQACTYNKTRFIALASPVWAGLSAESRLSDVVVFTNAPARGRGPLAEAFQQMVADEQTHTLPTDAQALERFAQFMGFPGSDSFAANRAGMLALIERIREAEGRAVAASSASRKRFESRG